MTAKSKSNFTPTRRKSNSASRSKTISRNILECLEWLDRLQRPELTVICNRVQSALVIKNTTHSSLINESDLKRKSEGDLDDTVH